MSRDYGELEREFIEGLAQDTGRDLAAWMALINARTFAHRNDMIDWLRQQGLTFAKASRLERIHHNGGRPLYGDRPPARPQAEAAIAPAPKVAPVAGSAIDPPPAVPAAPMPVPVRVEVRAPAPPVTPTVAAPPSADLGLFLAKAKGYRPLAELLIRNIRSAVPATALAVHDTHIDLAAPAIYGALTVTQKDVRLALALGEYPYEGDLKKLRLPGVGPTLTHTVVITDARRIDANLMTLVAQSAKAINS